MVPRLLLRLLLTGLAFLNQIVNDREGAEHTHSDAEQQQQHGDTHHARGIGPPLVQWQAVGPSSSSSSTAVGPTTVQQARRQIVPRVLSRGCRDVAGHSDRTV